MPKKGNRSYYDWVDLKARWLMSKEITLEAFFSANGIPTDTWKKHTNRWHDERTVYRQKLAEDVLQKHATLVAKAVARQSNFGAAGMTATFQKLFVQTIDPKSGTKTLMIRPDLDDRALVRLLDVTAKIEREAVRMNAPSDATGGQGGNRSGRSLTERELLDRISADPEALKAAEALYKALPKE
jgi:hypothetical protein